MRADDSAKEKSISGIAGDLMLRSFCEGCLEGLMRLSGSFKAFHLDMKFALNLLGLLVGQIQESEML